MNFMIIAHIFHHPQCTMIQLSNTIPKVFLSKQHRTLYIYYWMINFLIEVFSAIVSIRLSKGSRSGIYNA